MRSLVPLFLATAVVAQSTYTAYSVDALHGTFGHWAFFGALSTGGSDECRAQQVIPAHFLPAAGGLITGVEVSPHVTGTITYQRLDLALGIAGMMPPGTDMNANLPAPQTVYSATPGTVIAWPSATQWVTINFTTPYVYVPGTNLLFESRRVLQRPATAAITVSHQMSNGPQRRDLPHPVWAEGGPASGRDNAQFGQIYSGPHMLIRLVWAGMPTLNITGPRVSGTQFRLGQSLTITTQGSAGAAFAHAMDVNLSAFPVPVAPVIGLFWLTPGCAVIAINALDPAGQYAQTINIPSAPALAGLQAWFQSVTGTGTFTWTNTVDVILQP